MSKLKDFLNRILFDEDDVEEEPVPSPRPAGTSRPVKTASPEPVESEKPVVQRARAHFADVQVSSELPGPEVIKPEEVKRTRPVGQSFINVDEKPPVERIKIETVNIDVAEKPPVQPEQPKPVNPKPEKQEYVRTAVISPFFGLQQGDDEQENSPATISEPQLAGNNEAADSVIGTVFSPLYGDKTKGEMEKNDKVDEQVAGMTIDAVIAAPQKTATVSISEPETKVIEVEETVPEVRQYPNLKSTMTTWAKPEQPVSEEPVVRESRPDLNVTPFGVKKEEVPDESPTKKFETVKESDETPETKEEIEQLSLFDM